MLKLLDKKRLDRTRRLLRSEQLNKLEFRHAFRDQLSMMALLINMTTSFASPQEYRQITNQCGSAPANVGGKINDKKNARRRS